MLSKPKCISVQTSQIHRVFSSLSKGTKTAGKIRGGPKSRLQFQTQWGGNFSTRTLRVGGGIGNKSQQGIEGIESRVVNIQTIQVFARKYTTNTTAQAVIKEEIEKVNVGSGSSKIIEMIKGWKHPRRFPNEIEIEIETEKISKREDKEGKEEEKRGKKGYVDSKYVGYWLIFCSSMCFGLIVWGGLTRLTESGLSMVEWKPLTGYRLPRSEEEWEVEFSKYKEYPEYSKVHVDISMEHFKYIYFMEWFHRNIGRLFGLVYLVPLGYFLARGKIHRKNIGKVLGLGGLVGLQGGIGWFMVYSGLDSRFFDEEDEDYVIPRVSQYRLTMHLGMAYLLFIAFATYGWRTIRTNNKLMKMIKAVKKGRVEEIGKINKEVEYKGVSTATRHNLIMVLLTCLSGGMVAGLDAGLVYNSTFPHMSSSTEGELLPPTKELWRKRSAGTMATIKYNLFENPTSVQLIHRLLAISSFFSVSYTYFRYRKVMKKSGLGATPRILFVTSFGFVISQFMLGIGALLNNVHINWASAHQANSVLLVSNLLLLKIFMKRLPKILF